MAFKLTLDKELSKVLTDVVCEYSKGTKYGDEDFEAAHKLVDLILTARADALDEFPPPATVDLCMTAGADCVRIDGLDAGAAARRFRDFLEGEVFPGGGGAVFVSWNGKAARTDGAE